MSEQEPKPSGDAVETANVHKLVELKGLADALNRVQAVIEFELDGTILTANDNFLVAVGYELSEIQGKHHQIFCEPEYAASDAYRDFWMRLAMGEFVSGEFKRIAKNGSEIWINASYNPIFDATGQPVKVVKFATDVTAQKHQELVNLRKTTGFNKSSVAMMMVDRDLVVTEVNEATRNLLTAAEPAFKKIWPAFDASKIVGTCIDQFHKDPSHQRKLLAEPGNLPYVTDISIDTFKFELHVNAIFGEGGEYIGNLLEWADVTEARMNTGKLAAIDRSQAIIEFELDGTIITANENFIKTVGYSMDEIKGKHHRMFCEAAFASSAEYT
ncbi:MAG: PAS domain S-box protein, partial [Pseudomonadota bacterium]